MVIVKGDRSSEELTDLLNEILRLDKEGKAIALYPLVAQLAERQAYTLRIHQISERLRVQILPSGLIIK